MKTIKCIITILLLFFCFKGLKAQFILTGKFGSKDYYHKQTPDSVIQGSFNGSYGRKSIDINDDGIEDFELTSGCGRNGYGLQAPHFAFCQIDAKNNNQIAWIIIPDTCASGGGSVD